MEDNVYVIEQIIDEQLDADGMLYLRVRWEGFDESQDTWEPIAVIEEDCPAVLKEYRARKEDAMDVSGEEVVVSRREQMPKGRGKRRGGGGRGTSKDGRKDARKDNKRKEVRKEVREGVREDARKEVGKKSVVRKVGRNTRVEMGAKSGARKRARSSAEITGTNGRMRVVGIGEDGEDGEDGEEEETRPGKRQKVTHIVDELKMVEEADLMESDDVSSTDTEDELLSPTLFGVNSPTSDSSTPVTPPTPGTPQSPAPSAFSPRRSLLRSFDDSPPPSPPPKHARSPPPSPSPPHTPERRARPSPSPSLPTIRTTPPAFPVCEKMSSSHSDRLDFSIPGFFNRKSPIAPSGTPRIPDTFNGIMEYLERSGMEAPSSPPEQPSAMCAEESAPSASPSQGMKRLLESPQASAKPEFSLPPIRKDTGREEAPMSESAELFMMHVDGVSRHSKGAALQRLSVADLSSSRIRLTTAIDTIDSVMQKKQAFSTLQASNEPGWQKRQ